jgi:hypothetical protein
VQVIYDFFGQKCENVFNVKSPTAVDAAALTRIANKMKTWLTTYWAPLALTAASTSKMILLDLTAEGSFFLETPISPSIVGTDGNTALPAGSTLAIKWGTGLAGRSHRGRTFHVGLSTFQLTGNIVTLARAAVFATNYGALITTLASGGTVDKLVILSRCQDGDWIVPAEVTEVTTCTVDQAIDSQRRRLQGRGT